jgi:hypothetical protein
VRGALLLLFLLAVAGPAGAEGRYAVSARIEPDPVPFGGRFFLVVDIMRAESERFSVPTELPENSAVRPLAVPQRTLELLEPKDDGPRRVRETLRVPFLALDWQDVKTPALTLTTPAGEALVIDPLPVNVLLPDPAGSAPPGEAPLEQRLIDAEPLLVFGVFDARPLVAGGALALFAFALLALRALERRRRFLAPPPATAPLEPERPAHEVALARLEALLAERLLEQDEVGRFVTRLMDEVLRDYLERRYRVQAGRRTTSELAHDLLAVSAPGLDMARLRALLDDADLVKFARAALAAEVAHKMAGRVRELVEATKQSEGAP